MFKLVIEDDEGNKTVVPVIRDEITIGREDGNTIRLTERNVSRNHAKLVRDNGAVFLEEISARYGTRKNGEKIDGRTEFGPGDVFTIGDYRLTLQSETAPEANKPKKPNGAAPPPKNEFSNQPTQITKLDEVERREGTEIIAADPAKLVIVSSNFAGQEFPLSRKEMVIGRGEECDIIIDHRSVSQKHAKVVREQDDGYKIVDLKSKNGVKVGGEEYRAVHLKRGDIVELGHVKFRFVEPGENYVFTPQADDEFAPAGGSSNGVMIGLVGGALLVVVLAVVGFVALGGDGGDGPDEDPGKQVVTAEPAVPTPPKVDPDPVDVKSKSAEEMIAKAEDKYLAGKVFEASGILEAAKVQPDLSPEQVDKIDDLLSKCRREKQFARHFENGKDHYNNERWLQAIRAFHNIPPDPPSNIYKLMEEEEYVSKATEKLLEEAVTAANEAENSEEIEEAIAGPQELAEMFPDDEQIASVIDQIEEIGDKISKPVANNRPRPNNGGDTRPKKKKDPSLIEPLHREAFQASIKGQNSVAISKAKEAMFHGCTTKCYRVLGTAYKNSGDTSNACKWYAKAGVNTDECQ